MGAYQDFVKAHIHSAPGATQPERLKAVAAMWQAFKAKHMGKGMDPGNSDIPQGQSGGCTNCGGRMKRLKKPPMSVAEPQNGGGRKKKQMGAGKKQKGGGRKRKGGQIASEDPGQGPVKFSGSGDGPVAFSGSGLGPFGNGNSGLKPSQTGLGMFSSLLDSIGL